jgi:hypothetical protein
VANVQSLLGACLLAEGKVDEARPLLNQGYLTLRTTAPNDTLVEQARRRVQSLPALTGALTETGGGRHPASSDATLAVIPAGCRWHEVDDAGELPGSAQVTTGFGLMAGIEGTLVDRAGETDMYRIDICDPANFSATTANTATGFDTQLFLFDSAGLGVAANDDLPPGGGDLRSRLTNTFVPGAGQYYLAISSWNRDPYSATGLIFLDLPSAIEHPADGPGAGAPVMIWLGASPGGFPYLINLTGTCFAVQNCYANCDNSTTPPVLNVIDFLCFLNRFAQNDPWANCDGSTIAPVLNVNDFICFQGRFAAGCQ